MHSPDGKDYWGRGVYREIVRPERIAYSDSFSDEKGNKVSPTQYGLSADWPMETEVTVTGRKDAPHPGERSRGRADRRTGDVPAGMGRKPGTPCQGTGTDEVAEEDAPDRSAECTTQKNAVRPFIPGLHGVFHLQEDQSRYSTTRLSRWTITSA